MNEQRYSKNDNQLNNKAIALLSGGLDSRLAVKLVIDQGIEVTCLNMVSAFCTCTSKGSSCSEARKAAEEFSLPIKVKNSTQQMIEIIKSPKHGFGKNLNPCIDCRLLMFKEAKKLMSEIGASFIITGEVIGSRPMSQRMEAIKLIERESGLGGLVLRPLSAKLLPQTYPEKAGIIDRDKLKAIQGRSRKTQIDLAKQKEIIDYPCPAGGCLLTDKSFSERLKKMLSINKNPVLKEIYLLKYGRHFYIDDYLVVIGRNKSENEMIFKLRQKKDILFKTVDVEGPLGLAKLHNGRPKNGAGIISKTASIISRYSQGRENPSLTVKYWTDNREPKEIVVKPEAGYELISIYQEA